VLRMTVYGPFIHSPLDAWINSRLHFSNTRLTRCHSDSGGHFVSLPPRAPPPCYASTGVLHAAVGVLGRRSPGRVDAA
jgi:hypothetical protein